jgi:hypothetical protein
MRTCAVMCLYKKGSIQKGFDPGPKRDRKRYDQIHRGELPTSAKNSPMDVASKEPQTTTCLQRSHPISPRRAAGLYSQPRKTSHTP